MRPQQALASSPVLKPGEAGRHEVSINGLFETDSITYYYVVTTDGQQQWLVTRRYNDFLSLEQQLRGRVPLPSLPRKSVVRKLLSSSFADRRQKGLLYFLQVAVRADPGLQLLPQLRNWLGLPELRPPLDVGLAVPPPGSAQQPSLAQAVEAPTQPVAAGTLVSTQPPDPAHAQPAYAQELHETPVSAPAFAAQPTCGHPTASPTPPVYAPPPISQPAVPAQSVYAQPASAQPAYAQPAPTSATPVYAQPANMASPACTTPVYQHHDQPDISPAAAAVGAGAVGLVGGMLTENALENQHHDFIGGGGVGPGGPGICGFEEVIGHVRVDAFWNPEASSEITNHDRSGRLESIREQVQWGQVATFAL